MKVYTALHKPSGTCVVVVAEDDFDVRYQLINGYLNYDYDIDDWVMNEVDVDASGITEIS